MSIKNVANDDFNPAAARAAAWARLIGQPEITDTSLSSDKKPGGLTKEQLAELQMDIDGHSPDNHARAMQKLYAPTYG